MAKTTKPTKKPASKPSRKAPVAKKPKVSKKAGSDASSTPVVNRSSITQYAPTPVKFIKPVVPKAEPVAAAEVLPETPPIPAVDEAVPPAADTTLPKPAETTPRSVPADDVDPGVTNMDSTNEPELVEEKLEASDILETPDPPAASPEYALSKAAPRSRFQGKAKRRVALAVVLVFLIAGVAGCIHFFRHDATPNEALIAEVSALAVLPKGETPSVSTVVDKNKVNQTFLQNAADGDKVLLYVQAGRAVLYRPSTHQIVNMGPLTQPPAQVFLRNGATDEQSMQAIRRKLNQPSAYTLVSEDTSTKTNYTKTIVVDLTGKRGDIATRIAATIGGKVAALPDGESSPDADFLIIAGSNSQ